MEEIKGKYSKTKILNSLAAVLFVFAVTAYPAAAEHDKLFPDIEGWEMQDDVVVYTPETLWDIINGAADLFYAYDFREMYWGEYLNSEDNSVYIVMEIYMQGCPVTAFGVYTQERPMEPELIDIGVEGYTAEGILHFFAGDGYVKIRSHDYSEETKEAMENLARHAAAKLDPDPRFPDIVYSLPEDGKVEYSEEFINTNFLGHTFLSGAFVSSYEVDGNSFNLFVIENDSSEESKEILVDYYNFSGQDAEITEGIHRIEDRWNGEVGIVWKGNRLYGYYNLEDDNLQEKYLEFFSGK